MKKNTPFEFGGQAVAAGTRETIELPVSNLPDGTPVGLSVEVLNGKWAGPVVFISAAIHGDEVVGVEIVRRILQTPHLNSLKGTLLVVPIVNTYGFLNKSRYLPDRRDLNRSFPGSSGGSLTSRLAQIFLRDVVGRCELGIDLHSAAIHRTNFPQMRVSSGNPRTLTLSQTFGAPVILTSALREGSLRGEAAEMGVDVLLYEAGEGLRFDEMAVRAGVTGVLRVLNAKGMIASKGIAKPRSPSLICTASKWVRAPKGGLLRSFKADGDVVQEGDVLAMVSDAAGYDDAEVLAPLDGIIVGRAVLPVVNEGDALFHVAEVHGSSDAVATVEELAEQLENSTLFDEDEII